MRKWRFYGLRKPEDIVNRVPKNEFKFGVRFEDVAFGEESRKDVRLTPEDVAQACEEFAARIREQMQRKRESKA